MNKIQSLEAALEIIENRIASPQEWHEFFVLAQDYEETTGRKLVFTAFEPTFETADERRQS